tara:strand:- start:1475 stop:1645 length:171 start_codon:yes stop_codon:yes gene_type:complete
MTRKHFIAFAELCAYNDVDDAVAYDIAKVCKTFNGQFSTTKFFDYIYTLKEKIKRH